ncbi:MAG: DUF1206 domain-containing protein [Pseudonocardiales bacterium]|nr:DUF1206 domain-containing protein [Pseudonocardiales bacterium]
MSDVSESAQDLAGSGPARLIGPAGLAAYGGVHLVLAAVVAQIPFGQQERADKKGALEEIAETPAGLALLWLVTIGLAALVVWQLGEALWGHRNIRGGRRALRIAINLAEAAIFGVLAWSAAKVVATGGSATPSKSFAEFVFELPGGHVLVALAGVGLVIGAGYAVYRGLTRAFLRELDLSGTSLQQARLITRLGQLGWAALGLVYGTPGVLLIIAGMTYDPKAPTTLDARLHAVSTEPYGGPLIVALALGLVAFGVYCLCDAWYRKS